MNDTKKKPGFEPRRVRPYPKYKDSGIEWLGMIPTGWATAPLFTVAKKQDVRNVGGTEENVLSLSYGRIIHRDVSANFGLMPESFNTYQIVDPGNIVLRLTDLQNDKRSLRVGLVRERGIITSAYTTLRVSGAFEYEYAAYLLYAYDVTKVFYGLGGGVRQTMKFEDLKRMPLLLPPQNEQRAIAAYLDRETAKIDTLIKKKERLIELLQEKRTALITQAVTKGLDPTVPMKDSGIEWLGKIPKHWETFPFKRIFILIYRYPTYFGIEYCNEGIIEIRGESLNSDGCIEILEDQRYISKELNEKYCRTILEEGDLVMSVRGTMGKIAYVDKRCAGANITANLLRLSPNKDIANGKYLVKIIISQYFKQQLDRQSPRTTIQTITMPQLSRINIPLPPKEEQLQITAFLDRETAKTDALILKIREAVAHLKEYRTALISAAVTGKIDVREKAPSESVANSY